MTAGAEPAELTPAEVAEIRALARCQPVASRSTVSPLAMWSLVKRELAFWWDEAPRGYVLTNAGREWLRRDAVAQQMEAR